MKPAAVHPFLFALLNEARAGDQSIPWPEEDAWERILGEATQQGLIGLLFKRFSNAPQAGKLPPHIYDSIKARALGLAARNLVLAQELASILRALETRQVACAPVRGVALAELLYGEIAARPMGDVDLLVRKNDLPDVASALRDLGFEEMDRRPGFAQAYSYTLKFIKDRHGWIIVEPHWTLAYPPFADRLDMDAVWERCVRGRVLGMETRLLSREDLVLHLCLHLVHRGESAPLLWFYELDRLLRHSHDALDWRRMLCITEGSGLEGLLLEGLGSMKSLFDAPIPDEVFDRLQKARSTNRPRSIRTWLERRMVGLLAGESQADGRESLALLFMIKGGRAKLRYALALLFPSAEFMRLQYGVSSRSRIGFCYLGRIAYLALEGFKGLLGLLALRRPKSPATY